MAAYDDLRPEQKRQVDQLLAETASADGLAPVDLDRFWADNEIAIADPFGRDIPQCAFGAVLTGECVYDELGVPEDYWRFKNDDPWRVEVCRKYNDRAEKIVGRRILNETPCDPARQWPEVKGLHDIFEARNEWRAGSWWLHQSADTPAELAALLDRVERRLENLREFILPDNWRREKQRLVALGESVPLYRGQRGPVTFACSVFGPENLIFLIVDDKPLAGRFRDLIAQAILERARILDEEAGYTPETAPHGWGWADDNCCLLSRAMYEFFAEPIIRAVFDRYCPDPGDRRFQHSDSAMAQHLPTLARLGLNGTNFGPTVSVAEIRRHLTNAVISGELAPFTYSRNDLPNIVAEFLRDFEQAGDARGLRFATAGSINNGTRLTSMRLAMAAVQRFGRYDT